jgi:DNA-binding GntR family transcriptional regulator
MCEARLALELYMAKSVVQHATEKDILAMRQGSERALTEELSSDLVFEEGMHGCFALIARNQYLGNLYKQLMTLPNALYLQGLKSCQDEQWVRDFRQKHYSEEMAIIDAIVARDLSRLEESITLHVYGLRDSLLHTLKAWPPEGLDVCFGDSTEPRDPLPVT